MAFTPGDQRFHDLSLVGYIGGKPLYGMPGDQNVSDVYFNQNTNAYSTGTSYNLRDVQSGVWGAFTAPDAKPAGLTQATNPNTWMPGQNMQAPPSAQSSPSTNPQAAAAAMTDQQFNTWLSGQTLDAGQKQAIQAIYGAVSTNDKAQADRIAQAMSAAYTFSDPFFKAQIKMALDTMNTAIQGKQGDLAYQLQTQQNTLSDLQNNVAAAKDKLSFDAQQQLSGLATKYQQDMNNTRDSLAATGFTDSSRRAQQEGYVNQANDSAVASTNHQLAYDTSKQDASLSQGQRDYTLNTQRYTDLAKAGELSAYRNAEGQVGTAGLPPISGLAPLGGVSGSIIADENKNAASSINNYL